MLGLVSEFNSITGYKVNTPKFILLLKTNKHLKYKFLKYLYPQKIKHRITI